MKKRLFALLIATIIIIGSLTGCDLLENLGGSTNENWENEAPDNGNNNNKETDKETGNNESYGFASVDGIPDYSGKAYVALNNNIPKFTAEQKVTKSYEYYSPLDSLGRCGYTIACVGRDIMPTDDRESISSVYPSGWKNKKYSTSLVDGGYIYNRCHLIGFQLTGENANKMNLITGTRYLNIEGMLPFENMVADYVKETGNHVMYRVTPIFVGNNLVASGVQIEGWSVEDNGDGVCFNVFAYNVQPGIVIDYATGDNVLSGEKLPETESQQQSGETVNTYVLNTNTKKIHKPTCSSAINMNQSNRQEYTGKISDLLNNGYLACGSCKPN